MDFNEIYNDNFEVIMRIAYRITGSVDIAEDICQDVFVKYLEKFGDKNNHEQVRFYLIKMVRNFCYNYSNRKKIERKAIESYHQSEKKESNEDSLSLILRNEEISDIQKALLLIPYKYRLPIILREFEELSYKEIAIITKMSESNIKITLHRGKSIFKDKLKEINDGYTS